MAEEAAKVIPNPDKAGATKDLGVMKGQLLVSLVGDSLIQPFWPLGRIFFFFSSFPNH
jgi:hypothetical protein